MSARHPVLDAGCGEGVLVDEFADRLAIEGIDPNYSSDRVRSGSLTALPYSAGTSIARCAWTSSNIYRLKNSRARWLNSFVR